MGARCSVTVRHGDRMITYNLRRDASGVPLRRTRPTSLTDLRGMTSTSHCGAPIEVIQVTEALHRDDDKAARKLHLH